MGIEDITYVSSCCVCRRVRYEGRIITEEQLKKELDGRIYRLTHTFLSKSCANKFIEDVKKGPAYQSLAEKCE